MNRITLLIIAALSAFLAVAGLTTKDEEPLIFDGPPAEQPPYAAEETPPLVDSEVLEQLAKEPELIQEALVSTTTTTTVPPTTTTTTLAPTTTSPESESGGSSPTTTSPRSTTTTEPPTTTTTAQPGGFVGSAENEFASSINSYRSSNGLASLSRNGSLDSYARSWAKQMAALGGITHSENLDSLLGQWASVGENIGVGYSVGSLFDAFVDSDRHESTIVGKFTHMGIGVYQDADGAMWTTHVFAR